MNPLLLHEQYVTDHPDEKAPALALVDHRAELLDVTHRVALRAVAAIRHQARTGRDLAAAAAAIRPGAPLRGLLLIHIRGAAGADAWSNTYVFLVPGRRPPTVTDGGGYNQNGTRSGATVTVGARWVIGRAAELAADAREDESDTVARGLEMMRQ